MREIQDFNVSFCESFAKVPRELRESRGSDLQVGALSFSQLPHVHSCSLRSLSLSLTLTLTLSIFHLTLSLSLSLSVPNSLSLCLSLSLFLRLSHSCCLSVSFSLSLPLSLSLSLSFSLAKSACYQNHARRWFPESFAKVCFFSFVNGHFGNKEFRTTPM